MFHMNNERNKPYALYIVETQEVLYLNKDGAIGKNMCESR